MTASSGYEPKKGTGRALGPYPVIIFAVSFVVSAASFFLMSSGLDAGLKSKLFYALIALYLIVSVGLFIWERQRDSKGIGARAKLQPGEDRLLVFDEAREFFGGTLNVSDMFRLVASRVEELIPFQSSVLLLLDDKKEKLSVAECVGDNSADFVGLELSIDEGLAGKCYSTANVVVGRESEVGLDKSYGGSKSRKAAVAIPLLRDAEVFGILILLLFSEVKDASNGLSLFEAIGSRAAPLILSSVSIDRSISNALLDSTTGLPNDRAFFLILENQIAESQRKRDERPITVLAVDIKNFEEINTKYGHGSGNEALVFVARTVREQLRAMDFFARASQDEFLAILPTADGDVARDVMARIRTSFLNTTLKLGRSDSVRIDLNFGWASFWKDGETPSQLLNAARVRKTQAKSPAAPGVLWFP